MSQTSTIGEVLRAARTEMGLTVVQAAERLHVDAVIIEALEAGRFATLGAPVFVRGHLRRYAELLGEPDAPLQAQYAALQESAQLPDLAAVPHPIKPGRAALSRWPLLVVAALLLLTLVFWWATRVRPA
jgi:cytoskeleton protein RodZ